MSCREEGGRETESSVDPQLEIAEGQTKASISLLPAHPPL